MCTLGQMKQLYQVVHRDANSPKNNSISTQDQVIRPPAENSPAKGLSMQNMAVKMEGFITEAVCSCTSSTNMTDSTSQKTPVRRYSLKQNDRSCNQSTEGQYPLAIYSSHLSKCRLVTSVIIYRCRWPVQDIRHCVMFSYRYLILANYCHTAL